jgi:hypothetical protein
MKLPWAFPFESATTGPDVPALHPERYCPVLGLKITMPTDSPGFHPDDCQDTVEPIAPDVAERVRVLFAKKN